MKELTPIELKFILHWGEMGVRWGINRTVAQIHALLFVSPKPLTAEDICEILGVARSNVSNSLRELQNWKIVKIVHLMGDRRDHFEALKDVWEMFSLIAQERKRRELDPTLAVVRECANELGTPKGDQAYTAQRLHDLVEFFEALSGAYETLSQLPTPAIAKLGKLGDKVRRLLQ